MQKVAKRLYIALAVLVALAIALSLTSSAPLRQARTGAILGIYLAGFSLLIADRTWRAALVWCVIGVGSGLLYHAYEVWSASGSPAGTAEEAAPKPSFSNIPLGLLAWPVMLPEVVEYSLADAGVLSGGTERGATTQE